MSVPAPPSGGILLLPHAKVEGWSGPESMTPPTSAEKRAKWTPPQVYRYYDIQRFYALQASSDAHAVAYYIDGQEETYRLNKAALRTHQPFLRWVIFDLDREGHAKWENGEGGLEARAALDQAIASFDRPGFEGLYDTVSGYTTRGGLRLMWKLGGKGLPVPLANSLLRQMGALVQEVTGLTVDRRCLQWTRLFRIPCATREGALLKPYVQAECADDALDVGPLVAQYGWVLEDIHDYGGTPSGDRPEVDDLRLAGDECPGRPSWMKLGDPVPPNADGSTYVPLRRALVSMAARYEVVDPAVLYALAYESAVATPKRNGDELWKMAAGVAQWQEQVLLGREEEEGHAPTSESIEEEIPPEHWARIEDAVRTRKLRGLEAKVYSRWKHSEPTAPKRYDNSRVRELVLGAADFLAPLFNHMRHVHAILCRSQLDPDVLWSMAQGAVEAYRKRRAESDRTEAFLEEHPAVLICQDQRYWLDTSKSPYDYVPVNGNDYISLALNQYTSVALPEDIEIDNLLPPTQFFEKYGRILRRKEYVSGQKTTTWSAARGGELRVAIHELDPDIQPKYHADIAEYLRLLGGVDHGLLLDWLSHATYTAVRALPALLLHGSPNSGKSLLPLGLARLWGAAPADYNKIAGANFQSELMKSPLLLADDGIKDRSEWAATVFRQFVTNGVHAASIKKKDEVAIRCHYRIAVTANKDEGDPIPLGQSLGSQGIRAVQQRVLYIDVGPEPGAYLAEKVGRDRIEAVWLEGAIAEHALWLRDHHDAGYDPAGRLAVTPRNTLWHQSFAHNQGDKPLVAEVIYHLLEKSRYDGAPKPWAMNDVEGKAVWVSAVAFIEAIQDTGVRLKNPRDSLRKSSDGSATRPTRTYLYGTDGTFKQEGPGGRYYCVPWDVLTVNEVVHPDDLAVLTTTWRRRKQ